METSVIVKIVGIVLAVIALLVLILIPISFADLHYYEYGFLKRKSTGSVNLDKVYGPGGRHFVGPDYEFKVFPADAHVLDLDRVAVFASDRLEVYITVSMQYFLRKDQLTNLHKQYDIYYDSILQKNALDALKVAATGFSTREFISDRSRIETHLRKAVKDRLGGKCCEQSCVAPFVCEEGCKTYSTCSENDKGFFTEVRYFQLKSVGIPGDVESRFLKALTLQEETEKEKFLQEAKVVEKETEKLVNEIENTAAEISQNATAQSNLIGSKAQAEATKVVETARSKGLADLYDRLGITAVDQKSSFDYLRTIKEMDQLHLSVNFQQFIAGPIQRP